MKSICLLLAVNLCLLFPLAAEETVPASFAFSSSIRGLDGQLLANDTLKLQIRILTSSATGPQIFREYHQVVTDSSGLFAINVGKGQKPLGLFSNIKWMNDQYFLNIAVDTSGKNQFLSVSTTQVLILPIEVIKEASAIPIPEPEENFSHFLGEEFGGGLIFHIYKDSTGTEHGLVVSYTDVSRGTEWSNISSRFIGTNQRRLEGDINSAEIMAQEGHSSSAAKICDDFSNAGFSDWYLPGVDELKLLWEARQKIVKKKQADANYPGQDMSILPVIYWSSTEYNADQAMGFDFNNGTTNVSYKYNANYVRAVRKF